MYSGEERKPRQGSRFEWERLNPYTQDCSFVRHVGLDKLIRRFNVQHTGLTR